MAKFLIFPLNLPFLAVFSNFYKVLCIWLSILILVDHGVVDGDLQKLLVLLTRALLSEELVRT